MLEENEGARVTGVDISDEHLAYAKDLLTVRPVTRSLSFERGDITNLAFDDNSFDFVWCYNGLWLGDPDKGYLAAEPYHILGELKRITKPGGKIALLYWSSHKLLPLYPHECGDKSGFSLYVETIPDALESRFKRLYFPFGKICWIINYTMFTGTVA